jgi:hypothetical protein
MLIYWGCGEKAGPGQPVVIDFAKLAAGQVPPGFAAASFKGMTPPSAERHPTYGEWPNGRSRVTIPATGSLVGEHLVRGNYTPDIRFTLAQGQDFLAPLAVTNAPAASGAIQLGWRPVPTARAYYATAIGASQDGTMVMWSSSATQQPGMGVPDYMEDDELARLVANRTLMNPQTTQCAIPAEVGKAVPNAMVQMIAYGPQANFSYPPKPSDPKARWNPEWTAKLRSKSTHMAMLGMEMPDMSASAEPAEQGEEPARPKKKKRGLLRSLGEAVAREIP